MNAGKSTQLLQLAHQFNESGHKALLFTAAIDDRAGFGQISSRLGAHSDAMTFDEATDFYEEVSWQADIRCVLIDEAQFANKEQVRQLHLITALLNIPVICFGIRTDFQGHPFEGSTYLLALADEIQELIAICACSEKATMNTRHDENGVRVTEGDKVLIGGNDRYRQVCAKCFYVNSL